MLFILLISLFFSSNTPAIEYNKAIELYSLGKYELARNKLEKIIPNLDKKTQANAYFYIANSYFRNEKYLKSIDFYKYALRKRNDFFEAKYNLTLARYKLNKHNNKKSKSEESEKKAKDFFQKAANLEMKAMQKMYKSQKKSIHLQRKNW